MSKAHEDLERARKALQEKREQERREQKRRSYEVTFGAPRCDECRHFVIRHGINGCAVVQCDCKGVY